MTPQPAKELQRLLGEEPFVRSLAHSLATDPDDVVQQTWLHALQHQGERVQQPRPWLKRIVQNVVRNFRRSEQRRADRERAAAGHDLVPSSAELALREERRRYLLAAVDTLPDSLRSVVLLRYFEGLPPRRIAAKLSVPASTVSTRLNRGLELLRQRLDAEHGPCRAAWLLPLSTFGPTRPLPAQPLALSTPGILPTPLFWMGALAMQTKSKVVLGAAIALLVLVGGGAWFAGLTIDPEQTGEPREQTASWSANAEKAPEERPSEEPTGTETREVVARPDALKPTTGKLVVSVCYGDDKTAAADITVIASPYGGDFRVGIRRGDTDAAGTVTFTEMPLGHFYVQTDRGWLGERAKLIAGETTEIDLELGAGLNITGIVVDGTGTPIQGAQIEVAPLARSDLDAQILATSAADGSFAVRAANPPCLVGARQAGYASSRLRFLMGEGKTDPVRIVLDQPGGVVEGRIVAPDGRAVPDATVIIGKGRTAGIFAGSNGAAPIPALVRTGANGRFHAVGIPAGAQPVVARALGFAPWRGTCEVVPHTTASVPISMVVGAAIRGIARDAAGAPIHWADITIGKWGDIAYCRTHSKKDGSFEFTGLPAGELEIKADHDDAGRAMQRVTTILGSTAKCDLRLSRGLELKGRLLDTNEQPVKSVILECRARKPDGETWFGDARPDAAGRFVIANCPAGSKLTVTARGRAIRRLVRTGVDPRAGALELRVERTLPPSAHLLGRIVDPDGKPVRGAMLSARSEERHETPGTRTSGEDGAFDIGPLVPGKWSLQIQGTAFPIHRVENRLLGADARLDLGDIRLVRGGLAVVSITGDVASDVSLYAIDEHEQGSWSMARGTQTPHRSSPLAPGNYRLLVYGKQIAAHVVPFSIRPGEETRVAVRVQKGTAQRFEFSIPSGTEMKKSVRVRVLQGGRLVRRAWASASGGGLKPTTVWLAPGRYEVTVKGDSLAGTSAIDVGETEKAPVRIELR